MESVVKRRKLEEKVEEIKEKVESRNKKPSKKEEEKLKSEIKKVKEKIIKCEQRIKKLKDLGKSSHFKVEKKKIKEDGEEENGERKDEVDEEIKKWEVALEKVCEQMIEQCEGNKETVESIEEYKQRILTQNSD